MLCVCILAHTSLIVGLRLGNPIQCYLRRADFLPLGAPKFCERRQYIASALLVPVDVVIAAAHVARRVSAETETNRIHPSHCSSVVAAAMIGGAGVNGHFLLYTGINMMPIAAALSLSVALAIHWVMTELASFPPSVHFIALVHPIAAKPIASRILRLLHFHTECTGGLHYPRQPLISVSRPIAHLVVDAQIPAADASGEKRQHRHYPDHIAENALRVLAMKSYCYADAPLLVWPYLGASLDNTVGL